MSRLRLTIITPLALLAASAVLSLFDPSAVLAQDAITRLTIQQEEALVQHVRLADVVGPGNEFVEVVVGENGGFTIGTTGGDPDNPAEDNQDLIYGHPGNGVGSDGGPSTSGTTVRVNGTDYWNFSGGAQEFVTAGPTLQNDASIVEWTFDGVRVVQTLRIVSGTTSGRADAVQIRYDVTNTNTTAAAVGIRLMLDTMLGENDGAPFRIPGVGDVTRETEFAQANMPYL